MAAPLPPPETAEQRRARHHATLHQLADLGHDLAVQAHARAKQQLTEQEPAPGPAPDYATTFATLSRAVRQTIALEARLEAHARAHPVFRAAAPPDPRRLLLRRAFHDAVASDPDRARRRREIDATIEHALAGDPHGEIPISDTLDSLCNGLGIRLDLARLPDQLLDIDHRPYPSPS